MIFLKMSADIMLRLLHPPADAPMTPLADPSLPPEASADILMAPYYVYPSGMLTL